MRHFETVRLFVEFVAARISETGSHGPINSDRPGYSNIAPTFLIGKKLTPIWSRFGLNNVSARFHHIPVISQPRAGGHFRRKGGHLPRGTGSAWGGDGPVSRLYLAG
jgi:hypothetical protein